MVRQRVNSLGETLPLVLLVMLPFPTMPPWVVVSSYGDGTTFSQTLAQPWCLFCYFPVTLPISALTCNMLILVLSLKGYLVPLILICLLSPSL